MNNKAEKNGQPWTRDSIKTKTVFFDVFEPLFIRDALEAPGHLKELVFGDEWWKKHFPNSISNESVEVIRAMYKGEFGLPYPSIHQ